MRAWAPGSEYLDVGSGIEEDKGADVDVDMDGHRACASCSALPDLKHVRSARTGRCRFILTHRRCNKYILLNVKPFCCFPSFPGPGCQSDARNDLRYRTRDNLFSPGLLVQ